MIPAQAHIEGTCVGCDGDLDDWTPDCKSCRERMRHRALRSGSPVLVSIYRARAAQNGAAKLQEYHRARRDGERPDTLPASPYWGRNAHMAGRS